MKSFISNILKPLFWAAFFFCSCLSAYGAPSPAAGPLPTLTVGGRTMTDLSSNLITLVGGVSNTGVWGTLRQAGASSGYQVPAGKTLHIIAAVMGCGVNAQIALAVLYGTTDVGFFSASGPTGSTGAGGITGATIASTPQLSGTIYAAGPVEVLVPANDYPAVVGGFSAACSAGVIAYGYLQ